MCCSAYLVKCARRSVVARTRQEFDRATMAVPDIERVMLATMTSRLQRTESADLPRLAGIDQDDLRDLRTPHPPVQAAPRPSDQQEAPVA